MSRKKFIQSHGATCANWTWSWSFVNHKDMFVIFGVWDVNKTAEGYVVLKEEWEISSKGRRQPAYPQAVEHIRLVENEGYALKTFRMVYSNELIDKQGQGPAKINGFIPKLETKRLVKKGGWWYAVD